MGKLLDRFNELISQNNNFVSEILEEIKVGNFSDLGVDRYQLNEDEDFRFFYADGKLDLFKEDGTHFLIPIGLRGLEEEVVEELKKRLGS